MKLRVAEVVSSVMLLTCVQVAVLVLVAPLVYVTVTLAFGVTFAWVYVATEHDTVEEINATLDGLLSQYAVADGVSVLSG